MRAEQITPCSQESHLFYIEIFLTELIPAEHERCPSFKINILDNSNSALCVAISCSNNTSRVDSNDQDQNGGNGNGGEIIKPPFNGQAGDPGFLLDTWESKDAVIADPGDR